MMVVQNYVWTIMYSIGGKVNDQYQKPCYHGPFNKRVLMVQITQPRILLQPAL